MNQTKTASETLKTCDIGTDTGRTRKMLSEQVCAFIDLIATAQQVEAMNQKAKMRFVQACDFALSGDVKTCDNVTAPMFALVACATGTDVVFTDAHILAGASKEGNAVAGLSRAKLARFLPRTSNVGTIASKVSRTVGKGKKGAGFFEALGITAKGSAHGFSIINREHPLILAYAGALSKMTDGQFEILTAPKA